LHTSVTQFAFEGDAMSHHLTQPEEIDQVWMAHEPEEDTPQSDGCDVSFAAEAVKYTFDAITVET